MTTKTQKELKIPKNTIRFLGCTDVAVTKQQTTFSCDINVQCVMYVVCSTIQLTLVSYCDVENCDDVVGMQLYYMLLYNIYDLLMPFIICS